jgi:hypothetical protein
MSAPLSRRVEKLEQASGGDDDELVTLFHNQPPVPRRVAREALDLALAVNSPLRVVKDDPDYADRSASLPPGSE